MLSSSANSGAESAVASVPTAESVEVLVPGDPMDIRPDPTLALPPLPVHMQGACDFLADSERGNDELWGHIDGAFREFQSYLLHVTESYSELISLGACPVQTNLTPAPGVLTGTHRPSPTASTSTASNVSSTTDAGVLNRDRLRDNHHQDAIHGVLHRLNAEIEILRRTVETVQNVPSQARPLHQRLAKVDSHTKHHQQQQSERDAEEEANVEFNRVQKYLPTTRPSLPMLDPIRQAAQPYLRDPIYGPRLNFVVLLFERMLSEYNALAFKRKTLHTDINNFFLVNGKKICNVFVQMLDKTLLPALQMRLEARKTEERTTLHEPFQKRAQIIQKEKAVFYDSVTVWIEEQVNSARRILELVWRVIQQHQQQSPSLPPVQSSVQSSVAGTPTLSIAHDLGSATLPTAVLSPPITSNDRSGGLVWYEDNGVEYPTSAALFDSLRSPLHATILSEDVFLHMQHNTTQQHNYLKEFIMIWLEAYRVAITSSFTHSLILPEMMNQLIRWVSMVQDLFIRVLQQYQLQKMQSLSSSDERTSMKPDGSDLTNRDIIRSSDDLTHFLTLRQLEKVQQVQIAQADFQIIEAAFHDAEKQLQTVLRESEKHFERGGALHNTGAPPSLVNSNTTSSVASRTTTDDAGGNQSNTRQVRFSHPLLTAATTVAQTPPVDNKQSAATRNRQLAERLLADELGDYENVLQDSQVHQLHPDANPMNAHINRTLTDPLSSPQPHHLAETTLHAYDIEQACRLETLLHQRRLESATCKNKLTASKTELTRQELEAHKYTQVVEFLNGFQKTIVPQWRHMCQQERELVYKWNQTQGSYHDAYVRFRHDTVDMATYQTFATMADLRSQVLQMFSDLLTHHFRWMQDLQQLFLKSHRVIAQARQTITSLQSQMTLSLEAVSTQIQAFDNQLCQAVVLSDIFDVHAYETHMKKLTHTSFQLFVHMTNQLLNSKNLRSYLRLLDQTCCRDNRLGFGFPVVHSLQYGSHHPIIANSTTRLDRFVYDLHSSTKPMAETERAEHKRIQTAQRALVRHSQQSTRHPQTL